MRKILVFTFSVLLVFGFSGSVYAQFQKGALHNDGLGDSLDSGVDIDNHALQIFDSNGDGRYMKLTLDMGGTALPGYVHLDLDLDNDPNTGSSRSMTGIMGVFPPCLDCGPSNVLKLPTAGPDINVAIYLRDQVDTSQTAWCTGCVGPEGTCMFKGAACTGVGDCSARNTGSGACDFGEANCYLSFPGNSRTDCGGLGDETCYDMTAGNECNDDTPCGKGKWHGEYNAADYLDAYNDAARSPFRDRITMPLPPGEGSTDQLVIIMPLDTIIDAVIAANQGFNFDTAKAKDSANLYYQVSAWINPVEADDMLSDEPSTGCSPLTAMCINAVDVAPNWGAGNNAASNMQQAAVLTGLPVPCTADSSDNGKVGGEDMFTIVDAANASTKNCKGTKPKP